MSYRISVDSGGTFTDGIVLDDEGKVLVAKAHTTPADPSVGTIDCMTRLANLAGVDLGQLLASTTTIIHGTTLGTNIIATRTGAKLGTITTKGYRDRLSFMHVAKADLKGDLRQTQADLFDFRMDHPRPLNPRYLQLEVEERLDYQGNVLRPLNEAEVRAAAARLAEHGVESIAVLLMFSQVNPAHEQRAGEIIREACPGVPVFLSSEVLPMWGEIGRWSTTAFAAYVAPRVLAYVEKLEAQLERHGFTGQLLFMQSNGGVATAEIVRENPATLLLSGPTAGPAMGLALAREHGTEDVLSVDMGGTSFDVAVIPHGRINVLQRKVIDGKRFSLPSVDVGAIGAGGGSIAWVNRSGRLEVGPQSAGAAPGPACYAQGGTKATVTDADVVLGYLDPDYFLGGETPLRRDLAEAAIEEHVGRPLGLTVEQAAAAIYDVVNAKMAGAIGVAFTKRGFDPRDFVLCCAGGAGGVHGARLMQELGLRDLLVPKVAPVYCAFGMLYADLRHNYMRPYLVESRHADLDLINELYEEMEREGVATLAREQVAHDDIAITKTLDMRYFGQIRELAADVPPGKMTTDSFATAAQHFHDVHRMVIGYADERYPTEVARLHLAATAKASAPKPQEVPRNGASPASARKGSRRAYFGEASDFVEADIYDGAKLTAGVTITGPSIVEEAMTTVVIPPGMAINVDAYGNLTTVTRG